MATVKETIAGVVARLKVDPSAHRDRKYVESLADWFNGLTPEDTIFAVRALAKALPREVARDLNLQLALVPEFNNALKRLSEARRTDAVFNARVIAEEIADRQAQARANIVAMGLGMNRALLDSILANIKIFDRQFEITDCTSVAGWYVQVTYVEPDVETGEPALQKSRKWLVEPSATETDVVRTAYAAVTRSYAHVVSEHFTYKGKRVFGPHIQIDALLAACDALDE